MTQAINQSNADSTASSSLNASTLVTAAVSTAAVLQAALINTILLSCVDIGSKQDSDTNSLNNARSNASSEDTSNDEEKTATKTSDTASNKESDALNKFFSEMSKLSDEETKTADDSNIVAYAPGEGPSGGSNPPANVALTSFLFFIFEAMKNADASTGNRMIASGNSEIILGTNITNMIYNAWTSNPNTVSQSIDGQTGTGNGILGADANLFEKMSQVGGNYQSDWMSQASTLESIDSSTANTNEGTGQQQTQTWANQLSNDSQDEQGLLTTMIPDITGFGQQMAGYLGTALPA